MRPVEAQEDARDRIVNRERVAGYLVTRLEFAKLDFRWTETMAFYRRRSRLFTRARARENK